MKKTNYYLCVLGIFIGTIFYTLASYYHLKMGPKWTFLSALLLAIPFLLLEYTFSLNANYYLHYDHGLSPSKILSMTVCFNFITIWLFNYFVMQNGNVNFLHEFVALVFILTALYISNMVR